MKRQTFRYQMDGLIALLLFGVFATCVLAVLLSGAGAYRRLDETFPLEHDGITVYFFEKVRQPTHGEMSALADLIHQTHPDMVVPTWPETPGNGIGVS